MRTETREHEHALLGLPKRDVTITAVLVAATVLVCAVIAFARGPIQTIDDRFLQAMLDVRSDSLTAVATVFNVLGLVAVTLPVRIVVAAYLAFRRRWWHVAAFVSAMVVAEACIGPIKALYERPRPPASLALVSTSSSSFPSGHAVAAASTVVAMVIALFPEGPRRYGWGAAAVAFSLLMALSRAYLAAHWMSDAVAGVLIGTSAALVTAVVIHFVREGKRGWEPSPEYVRSG